MSRCFRGQVYDPACQKVIRSRDAKFIEDQKLKDIGKEESPIPQVRGNVIDFELSPSTPTPEIAPEIVEAPNQEDAADVDDLAQDENHDIDHDEQPQPNVDPVLRRSTRERRPPRRYADGDFVLVTDGGEPESFDEAMHDEQSAEWMKAMQDEMNSLHENHTYDLVKLPKGMRALRNKWVYRLKQGENSSKPRYKARLVVKGFSQRKGIDFDEIFSPVVKMSSIRTVLAMAASLDLEVEQMDVKTAFLHGDLEQDIYMVQPEGFVTKGKEDHVCKLKKSLYGLKQAPRQWYMKFESVMGEQGYLKTNSDHCVFVQRFSDDDFIYLLLYVDDILIVGRNTSRIQNLKNALSKSFAMKDLGGVKQILGMSVTRDRVRRKLYLSQEKYIQRVLQRFGMNDSKPVSAPLAPHFKLSIKQSPTTDEEKDLMNDVPYASAVGSLMYAMICTRPDIAHAVSTVSRFLSNPGKEHWNAVKWIMRYLRGTYNLKLSFGDKEPVLVGYTDSDMAGDIDSRKSTSGFLVTFAGGAVAWQSRL